MAFRGPLLVVLSLSGCRPANTGDGATFGADSSLAGWLATLVLPTDAADDDFRVVKDGFELARGGLVLRLDTAGALLKGHDGEAHIKTKAVGRRRDMIQVSGVQPTRADCRDAGCAPRVEFRSDAAVEWWVPAEERFEQGWTLRARPSGAGPIYVDVTVADGSVELVDPTRLRIGSVRVSALSASDADGRPLPATFERMPEGYSIRVDDASARYPIEIDPIYDSATWTVRGDTGAQELGTAMAANADVNGDGYGDAIVGTSGSTVYVYLGSSTGLPDDPATTLTGPTSEVDYGETVASGDVNGDGYDDVLVGSARENTYGRVYVHFGSSAGVDTAADVTLECPTSPSSHRGSVGASRRAMLTEMATTT